MKSNLVSETNIIPSIETPEGAGVTVHRSIGSPAIRNLDPFILFDHFNSSNPDDYIAGFPSHPHRGFCTFTYMIDGYMEHKDSIGNTGLLEPGSAQLMKAARGIIHSELPKQENGLMRGFQLWINLPSKNKMDPPEYQEFKPKKFPTIRKKNYYVRLLMGSIENCSAPIVDSITQVSYFDINVFPNKNFKHTIKPEHNGFIFVFEGKGALNNHKITAGMLVVLGKHDHDFLFSADNSGARFIVASGLPINEPIVQHGPFVMTTKEEINKAITDFRSNKFVANV